MSGRATKRRGMTSAVRWWLFIFEIAAITVIVRSVWANSPVTFDMAPAAVARPVTGGPWTVLPGYEAVEVRLQVSTLIDPGLREPVEQLLYRFASRERQAIVLDYSPRTEMLSAIDGAVEVVITDEATQHVGLNMTGVYPPVKTDACLDQNQKNLQSTKYRQQVKHESVVASGTIDQSRGAYFKLRSAYDRTLEGDKPFSLILQLPLGWQTSTLDVQLQAGGNTVNRVALSLPIKPRLPFGVKGMRPLAIAPYVWPMPFKPCVFRQNNMIAPSEIDHAPQSFINSVPLWKSCRRRFLKTGSNWCS